jgi:hypothetical protein
MSDIDLPSLASKEVLSIDCSRSLTAHPSCILDDKLMCLYRRQLHRSHPTKPWPYVHGVCTLCPCKELMSIMLDTALQISTSGAHWMCEHTFVCIDRGRFMFVSPATSWWLVLISMGDVGYVHVKSSVEFVGIRLGDHSWCTSFTRVHDDVAPSVMLLAMPSRQAT